MIARFRLLFRKNAKSAAVKLVALFVGAIMTAASAAPPDIMLAKKWRDGLQISEFLASEKMDGVRARWDGEKLISRNGKVFAAPAWFVADFPNAIMDGELWAGRGRYQKTASIVRRQKPHDGWKKIRFMIFDLPKHGGVFAQRVAAMKKLTAAANAPYLQMIEQKQFSSNQQLMARFMETVNNGGEGLMLHRKSALYAAKRSNDLLKLKPFDDSDAVVIGYRPGKGKYLGMTGSLQARLQNGKTFFVGSGLSDKQRKNPPPLGALITFRHQGLTDSGVPRFPVFLRVRDEKARTEN